MSCESTDDEVDIRQRALFQGGIEIGDIALRVGVVGGDEAVLLEQVEDEGDAGSRSLLDERVEA